MADEDLFMDQATLQKMIAAGIYDESMANKVKDIKNKDLKDNTMVRPAAERQPPRQMERQSPFPSPNSRGRGFGRGQKFMAPPGRGRKWEQGGAGHMHQRFGFQPLSNTAHKWQEMVPRDDTKEKDLLFNKRPRSPSTQRDSFRDGFRDGIRDGIQNKIQRNELERNLNNDFNNERNGNSCNDTDLRPKSDTDSRIRDTDLRPASNPINSRKTALNLPIISAANDPDYRRGSGDTGGMRGGRNASFVKSMIDQKFFGSNSSQRSGPSNVSKNVLIDDLDDFIEKASSKLKLDPAEINAMSSRGRGRGEGLNRSFGSDRYHRSDDPLGLRNPDDPLGLRQLDDPIGLRQPEESFRQRATEDDFDSGADIIEIGSKEPDENPIAILKETVEELAKSNLYCQYCDCYLGSLVEVNTHIGTANHQKNMAKKIMEENNKSDASSQSKPRETPPISRPISQTIVERVPTGMSAIVQMIEQRKQISLKSLTEMDNYEITCDSEAALAKELAKLLTNELLNYKMNLMPDTVKEALKHQGIGLLNSMLSN